MKGFEGKRILITGAGGGIGRALVDLFAERGATILAHDRTADRLDPVLANHPDAVPIAADLTDAASVEHAFADAGVVDVLVNNAGAAHAKTAAAMTHDAFRRDVDLNLTGTWNAISAVLPGMKSRGCGSIVTIGTVNALGSFGHPAYAAAKAGLISLTRSLAVELGRYGIRVNIVCPGTVRTPAWNDRVAVDPKVLDEVGRWYPLGRVAEPQEVARVVAFLASDEAAIITGATLAADCGLTAGQPPLVSAFTLEEI